MIQQILISFCIFGFMSNSFALDDMAPVDLVINGSYPIIQMTQADILVHNPDKKQDVFSVTLNGTAKSHENTVMLDEPKHRTKKALLTDIAAYINRRAQDKNPLRAFVKQKSDVSRRPVSFAMTGAEVSGLDITIFGQMSAAEKEGLGQHPFGESDIVFGGKPGESNFSIVGSEVKLKGKNPRKMTITNPEIYTFNAAGLKDKIGLTKEDFTAVMTQAKGRPNALVILEHPGTKSTIVLGVKLLKGSKHGGQELETPVAFIEPGSEREGVFDLISGNAVSEDILMRALRTENFLIFVDGVTECLEEDDC